MMSAGETTKKVVFYDTDKRHANLKIRLHYDGLTQAGFFRGMVTGYLDFKSVYLVINLRSMSMIWFQNSFDQIHLCFGDP